MIDINEINEEIKRLESKDHTTYDICEKLAALYMVRDHFKPTTTTTMNSMEMEMSKPTMR